MVGEPDDGLRDSTLQVQYHLRVALAALDDGIEGRFSDGRHRVDRGVDDGVEGGLELARENLLGNERERWRQRGECLTHRNARPCETYAQRQDVINPISDVLTKNRKCEDVRNRRAELHRHFKSA